ncbi:hypothetical protein [Saccharothrix yanglingensis]|uniref:Uncharacterized protein n=1 Tax=Saccharothrix yanglingensis TaxID=659496 RepID=A0ABU0WX47_9PSEU|nr:hypothetical protein [Saccharothrix yanglingensis]MDQ2582904.1 hypothetical protein [Saccharothrix yanglingensis]
MTLPGAHTLLLEQPWTARSLFLRTRFRMDVRDERGTPLATVAERAGLGPLRRLLRATGFSGRTRFDLVVADRGHPVLRVTKGAGRPPVQVFAPDGALIGSVRNEGRGAAGLYGANGDRLASLGDAAGFTTRRITEREGRKVRRDTVRLRPGTPEPVRSLAIAAAIAHDVVRGVGTNHAGGGPIDLPF